MNVGCAHDRYSRGEARRAASNTAWRGVHTAQATRWHQRGDQYLDRRVCFV